MNSTTDHDAIGGFDAGADLLEKAIGLVTTSQKASCSHLQRGLRISYNTAASLIERMESRGIVGAPDERGRRAVHPATPDPILQRSTEKSTDQATACHQTPAPAQSAGAAADREDDVILYAKDWWNHERRSVSPVASRGDMEALADIFARRGTQPHNPAAPSPDKAEAFARGDVAEVEEAGRDAGSFILPGKIEPLLTQYRREQWEYGKRCANGDDSDTADAAHVFRDLRFAIRDELARPAPVLDRARPAGQGEGEPSVSWLANGIVHAIKRDDADVRRAFFTVAEHALCEAHYADMLARIAYFTRDVPTTPSAAAPPAPVSRATSAPAQDAEPSGVTQATKDVLAERRRQVEGERWTEAHDDAHVRGEIAAAAGVYALVASGLSDGSVAKRFWPWDFQWWKPCDPRRNLVKAGALILAEIERIDRADAAEAAARARRTPDAGQEVG